VVEFGAGDAAVVDTAMAAAGPHSMRWVHAGYAA